MVVFLLSGLVNQVAKHLAAQPRPFQYDSRVKEIVGAEGFGLPSGHTQSAVVVWGFPRHDGAQAMVLGCWRGRCMCDSLIVGSIWGCISRPTCWAGTCSARARVVAVAAGRHPVGGVVLQPGNYASADLDHRHPGPGDGGLADRRHGHRRRNDAGDRGRPGVRNAGWSVSTLPGRSSGERSDSCSG